MQNAFHLNPPASISRQHLERMLGNDQLDELMEEVVEQYQQIANKYDVIVCEGLVPSNDSTYAEQVNVAIAQALDAKVIFVSTGDLAQPNAIADKLDIYARDFGGLDSERTLGTILMRVKGIDEVHDVDFGGPGEALLGLTQDQLQQIHQHSPSFGYGTV
jgi:phosphate acetyltransferase